MTSTCVMNQVVLQTHLLISKIDVNRIIQTCDSLVLNQNKTIKQLISLFTKIAGYESYCQQIVLLCNQILSDTVTGSNHVVNVCKWLKPIDLPSGPGSSTSVKNGDQITKEVMSKACKDTRLHHNDVSPSSLKQPEGTRKCKSRLSKRSKGSQLKSPIATINPVLPIVTRNPLLPIATRESEPTLKNSANTETCQAIDDIGLLKNSGIFLKSHLTSNSKSDTHFTKLPEAAPSVPFPVKPPPTNVSHISSDSVCENVMDQVLETSGQGSLVEVIVGDDLNLSSLEDEGQVLVIIEEGETLEFNDVTNLYDELTIPVGVGKPNTTMATSESRLSIATDTPNVTMVTSKPELFISTNKSDYNEFPIVTDKSELPIATELSIATSPYQKNIKSSKIVEPTLKNSTEARNNRLQSNAANGNVLQSHSLQLSKQNKEFLKSRYPFQCSLCPKSFDRNKSLIRHTNVHAKKAARLAMKPPSLTFICEICGKIFKKRQRLREHKAVHLDHKPVACPHCDYRCVSKRYLTTHMIKHNGEKIHQCEKCGKCFNRIHSLRFHEMIHNATETDFVCDLCPSRFLRSYLLHRHKKQIHENPIECSCQVCGKTFNRKYGLSLHMRRHTTEKPFPCDICGKKYKHKKTLRKHRKICDGGERMINDSLIL
ncbi:hypothetical protein SNE40_013641 [Patella caerulea]|uniref:C2H2-type domain-containing protein n=1 Tax=Patella caerulea TaxID=87958 RepID=A0AAN8JGE6_PATCE